jgi:hypothetical protein
MSKIGVKAQNYEIEVPGYEGKILLRRLLAKEINFVKAGNEDDAAVGLAMAAALTPDGKPAYSSAEEITEDLPLDLIIGIAKAVIKSSSGEHDAKN